MSPIARLAVATLGIVSVSGVSASDFIPKPYVGAQYGHTNFNRGALNHVNQNHVTARVGAEVLELFGVEARFGTGFTTIDKGTARVKGRYHYGVYGVINLPTDIAVSPYVIGGYTHTSTGINGENYRDDSAAYGLGLNWNVSDAVSVNGEFMRLVDNDWSRQSSTSFGVKFAF